MTESSQLANVEQLIDFQVDVLVAKAVPFTKAIFDRSVLSEMFTIEVFECAAVEGVQTYRIAYHFRQRPTEELVARSAREIRLQVNKGINLVF